MSGKEKASMILEDVETVEDKPVSTLKPSWNHLEEAVGNIKSPREPYWDTPYVIGASRSLSPDVSNALNEKPPKRARLWKRIWRHYKRYWILYTIAAFIFLAIFLPILFLVIFPAIAQNLVDNASLPIHSASIMNPTPNSVVYSMVASLKIPAGVTVALKPLTLNLFTNESSPSDPYIRVGLPEYHLKGDNTVTIVNQTATILDLDQFEYFLSNAINAKEFTLEAAGLTVAYLGHLKAPLNFNKKIQLAGLNQLAGFSFTDAAIVFPPEADGTNLRGSVILPNPSIVTFALGNVTLNMIVGGITIGQGFLDNVVVSPGNNTVAIRAVVDLKTMIENLPAILQAEASSITNGNVLISATGNSTIYDGLHIPYYETVLNNLFLTGEMPIVKLLIDSLEQYLGSNNSLISNLLGAVNGTSLLSELLGGLSKSNSSSSSLLSSLGL